MAWTPLAPNEQQFVQDLANRYPDEFRNNPLQFIKRCAWELHKKDSKWGLNGKRGTFEISDDILAYLNSTVVFSSPDVSNLPGCEAFDVIRGANGPNPEVTWFNITDPDGSGSRWIQPTPIDSGEPNPPNNELERRVQELEGQVNLLDAANSERKAEIDDLRLQVLALRNEVAKLSTDLVNLTNRYNGHVHRIYGVLRTDGPDK